MDIRIATRKSELAMWQAGHVAGQLRLLDSVTSVSLVPLSTRGDEILDRSLQKIGGKGLFIKELELAMEAGNADIAVHSMKDVPAELPTGFCIAATLARDNPRDALLTSTGAPLDSLAEGARIGSSSLRRQAQLKALRPDIEIVPLRGNVNTRLAKLDDGEFDAIILACAGLERLGLADRITHAFDPTEMLPATAQGVIGIECLADRSELRDVLGKINDEHSAQTTAAERAVALALDANCQSPVASYATVSGHDLVVRALVSSADGSKILRCRKEGAAQDAGELGTAAGRQLLGDGAADLLREHAQ